MQSMTWGCHYRKMSVVSISTFAILGHLRLSLSGSALHCHAILEMRISLNCLKTKKETMIILIYSFLCYLKVQRAQ